MARLTSKSSPNSDGTLNLTPNIDVKSDRSNPAVATAIQLIQDNLANKNDRDSKNQLIRDLFEQGFTVKEPKGPRKIQSKMIQQVIWRMASRMKPLDFTIHGVGRPEAMEKLVTDGVSTVMDKGKYISSLRDKNGAFINLLLYGDSFIQVGTQEKGIPIVFNTVDNANVYTDTYCTKIRGGWGRQCRQMVVVFSYSWSEVVDMFPDFKDKMGDGKIPRDLSFGSETDRDITQTNDSRDLTEVAYFYDLNSKNYTVFVGSQTTIVKELSGDDFPFTMEDVNSGNKDRVPFIPVIQYMCQPSAKGFFNHGVGDMIYDLAIVSRQLMNMAVGHAEDNVYPITHVNVPQGEASKYFNKLSLAHEMRESGKKGFVAMEYDPSNPNGARVTSESLTTQSLVNEWQLIFDNLVRELTRMGINIDDADRGADVTATQILAEEEAQNALIKQIMEWNASESKFAVELTLDFIKDFVGKNDKTPLNLATTVEIEGEQVGIDSITLGMISDELRKEDYFVKVNSRSGAIPSNTFKQAQLSRVLQTLPPGSPAFNQRVVELAKLNDVDLTLEQLAPPQQPQAAPGDVPVEAAAASTERQSFEEQGAPAI